MQTSPTMSYGDLAAEGGSLPFHDKALLEETYQLAGVLGTGGMSVVYDAYDVRLRRKVAIKAALNNAPTLPLVQEGQALAAIHHPSIVGVHALGRHHGTDYLVMERIAGSTLATQITERSTSGRFTSDEIVDLLTGIAEGLRVVHDAGISHRDVKPGNVMIAPGGRVVLMDFGLFQAEFDQRSILAGSPHYMAPETFFSQVATGGGRLIDLYALGVVGFELCTGFLPYLADTPVEILRLHAQAPVPDPGFNRDDLPPQLVSLVRELLAKKPDERPASADELLQRLREVRVCVEARYSVLIVDDDPVMREVMHAIVAAAAPDAEIDTATDGESAIGILRQKNPSLMLLDLNLPGMNGMEVCMYLLGAADGADCRIVAVSGSARGGDVELLRELRVTRFVPKDEQFRPALEAAVRDIRRLPPRSAGCPAD